MSDLIEPGKSDKSSIFVMFDNVCSRLFTGFLWSICGPFAESARLQVQFEISYRDRFRTIPCQSALDRILLFSYRSAMLRLPNTDRDPIPRWSFGRVMLIGDAAHPMQTIGTQAGSQAVVDARVLAASLMAARPVRALFDIKTNTSQQWRRSCRPPGSVHRTVFAIHDALIRDELESTAIGFKQAAGFRYRDGQQQRVICRAASPALRWRQTAGRLRVARRAILKQTNVRRTSSQRAQAPASPGTTI
jgi:hypothetical protein